MPWNIDLPDVVAGTTIETGTFGNPVLQRLVHLVTSVNDLPNDVGDGGVAYATADQSLWVRHNSTWKAIPFADGTHMNGILRMNGNVIVMGGSDIQNLGNPTGPGGAVNRQYGDGRYLMRDGTGTMDANLSMNGNRITNLGDPVSPNNAVSLAFANSQYTRSDGTGTMSGDLSLGGNSITNVADPGGLQNAATPNYCNNNYLKLDGSNSMSGNLGMSNNRIVGVADPTGGTNAMPRSYADGRYQQTSSAAALKQSIRAAGQSVADLAGRLEPVTFDWSTPTPGHPRSTVGFIAEQVHQVSPLLTQNPKPDGTVPGVDLRAICAVLVAAVQDLTARVDALEAGTAP